MASLITGLACVSHGIVDESPKPSLIYLRGLRSSKVVLISGSLRGHRNTSFCYDARQSQRSAKFSDAVKCLRQRKSQGPHFGMRAGGAWMNPGKRIVKVQAGVGSTEAQAGIGSNKVQDGIGSNNAHAGISSNRGRPRFESIIEDSEVCICSSQSPSNSKDEKLRVWQVALIDFWRAFALSCAVACIAGCLLYAGASHAAVAADSSVLEVLGEQANGLKVSVHPKLLQVLAVFKDQGVLLAALLGLSAFFSMAETSIMTLWPWKVRELAEKEGEGGVFGLLSQDVTRFLTTILIGTTVVNIAATALVTDAATSLFGEAGVTAATGVMTVVILLVTEIAPKSIAVHNATKVARFAVRPVKWLSVILYPVGRIVTALSMALLKLLGLKSTGETSVSEEELKLMLRGAELSGAIEEEEQDMIENVLEIKDTFVREVMTPLVDVVAIDAESTLMEFREYWVKHQYSRTPVYERRIDNIVGIAYAMDMLDYIDYDSEQVKVLQRLTVGRIAHRPAYFVPDSMSVWNLLREFRIRKVHMAIVLNEYGGAVGVVTLEDVVEEIVGEIFDENDSKEEIRKKTGYVVQRADGVFDVDANTHIEDLSEALEVKMPEGPYRYETVSGFVCEAFGYIPRTGESIDIILKKAEAEDDSQADNKEKFQKYRLEVLAGNARKVGAVRFQVSKSEVKEDEVVLPRSIGAFGKVWAKPVNFNDEETCKTPSDPDDEYCEAEIIEDCIPGESAPEFSLSKHHHLIAEPVNLDSEMTEAAPPSRSGSTMFGSGDWTLLSPEPTATGKELMDDGEMSPKGRKASDQIQGWVLVEKQVERRLRRRMKQSVEAEVEVDRQRRVDLLRQQVELEMAAMKQERDTRSEPDSFQEVSA